MKAFIIVKKERDDYSTLPAGFEPVFLFDYVTCNPSKEVYDRVQNTLIDTLDNALPGDRIIFNGPSWVIALAGYVWFASPSRVKAGILLYNNITKHYMDFNYEYQ